MEFLKSKYSVKIPSYLLDFAVNDQTVFARELSTCACLLHNKVGDCRRGAAGLTYVRSFS